MISVHHCLGKWNISKELDCCSFEWHYMGSFILRMGTCHIDGELEGGSLKVFGNATRGGDITDGETLSSNGEINFWHKTLPDKDALGGCVKGHRPVCQCVHKFAEQSSPTCEFQHS